MCLMFISERMLSTFTMCIDIYNICIYDTFDRKTGISLDTASITYTMHSTANRIAGEMIIKFCKFSDFFDLMLNKMKKS